MNTMKIPYVKQDFHGVVAAPITGVCSTCQGQHRCRAAGAGLRGLYDLGELVGVESWRVGKELESWGRELQSWRVESWGRTKATC